MNIDIYIVILLLLNIIFFLLGFLLGKNQISAIPVSNTGFTKNTILKSRSESIDSTKYVTTIDTSGLDKKYDSLGDTVQTQTDISTSINKLKNMKG